MRWFSQFIRLCKCKGPRTQISFDYACLGDGGQDIEALSALRRDRLPSVGALSPPSNRSSARNTDATSQWNSGMLHAAPGAGGRDRLAGVPSPVVEAQQASLSSRRYYDLVYVLTVFLAFPLYWTKVMDWRLCGAAGSLEADPWLMRPPSPTWIAAWPCNGSQASKLRYMLSSPGPFLRSLVWPICPSELHFSTSLYLVIVGGLVMLAATRGCKYDRTNKWRLLWAFIARAQVRVVTIAVKLLRPQTPWPLVVSQLLPVEGPAGVMYNVALMGPPRHQAAGAVMDVLNVSLICAMYGSAWPHAMPPLVLIMLQAACGLLTVGIAALLTPAPPREVRAGLTSATLPKRLKAGLGTGVASGGQADRSDGGGRLPRSPVGLAPRKPRSLAREPPGAPQTPVPVETVAAETTSEPATVAPAGSRDGRQQWQREQQLMQLCRSLVRADTGAGGGWQRRRRRSSSAGRSDGGGGDAAKRRSDSSRCAAEVVGGGETERATVSAAGGGAWGEYGSALAWSHLQMKIPGLDPSVLPPGAEGRITKAVGRSCAGAAGTGVAIRSGCIEVHLDLVRGVLPPPPTVAAAAVGSFGAIVATGQGARPADSAAGARLDGGDAGASGGGDGLHAPASAEQQGLASCILQALGLPSSYDAAVRAQVGSHLLTLTPAADSGGGWAVLGTRRMQAHEVPYVTRVEPPAVVAPPSLPEPAAAAAAAAAGGGGHLTTATLRMTVSGSAERLAAAHMDVELEVVALFEGAFLTLSDLQWGELEGGSPAGGGGCFVRLPPALALCRRVLSATLALPAGRTGAIGLLLMRRGTAGQSYPLLLVQPEDAGIAAEVAELEARTHTTAAAAAAAACGLPVGSTLSFVRDLGFWLQYRDFWQRKAAQAEAAAAAAAVRGSSLRSALPPRRLSLSWMGALMSWSRRCADGGGGGGGIDVGGPQPPVKAQRCTSAVATRQASHSDSSRAAAVEAAVEAVSFAPSDDSDLLDQDDTGGGGGGGGGDLSDHELIASGGAPQARHRRQHNPVYTSANGRAQGPHGDGGNCTAATAVLTPAPWEQQRHGRGALLAFGQRAYQTHMATARRVLLEFALEQRCATVAAALLAPAPVPPTAPARVAGAAAYGTASYIAELAEASRASSPDGLTLLHRAVRSGDAATVKVTLDAAARAADAAAAAAALEAAPLQPSQPPTQCPSHDGQAGSWVPGQWTCVPLAAAAAAAADTAATCADASAPAAQRRRFSLYDWDARDAHGITPLHYVAVLDDGGALAAHLLRTRPEALALWHVGGPDLPSPASFAAQNGVLVDTTALRRESERALGRDAADGSGGSGGEAAAAAPAAAGAPAATTQGSSRALLLSTLWGFPRGDVEQRYQRFARARARSGGLPAWLLVLHMIASTGGVLQALSQPRACCRSGMLPLLALQAGSFLLTQLCNRPASQGRAVACRVTAWAMQALALAVLLARTLSPLAGARPGVGCTDSAAQAAPGADICGDGDGEGGGGGGGGGGGERAECGSGALHQGLLALHHALAVASVPYAVPHALHRVLAVVAVEVVAAVLCGGLAGPTSWRGRGRGRGGGPPLGAEPQADSKPGPGVAMGLRLVWAGGAAATAACVTGGWLLRGAVSWVVLLAADLQSRAAFVSGQHRQDDDDDGDDDAQPPKAQVPVTPSPREAVQEVADAAPHQLRVQQQLLHDKLD